jgi:hypothetical protein
MENITKQQVIAIKALNLFFYNYTSEDIQALKNGSRNFEYFWENKLDKSADTFPQLWDFLKNSEASMYEYLLEYAMKGWKKEAERFVNR